jgi:hypothetical protein
MCRREIYINLGGVFGAATEGGAAHRFVAAQFYANQSVGPVRSLSVAALSAADSCTVI